MSHALTWRKTLVSWTQAWMQRPQDSASKQNLRAASASLPPLATGGSCSSGGNKRPSHVKASLVVSWDKSEAIAAVQEAALTPWHEPR